jgi:mono/diheme cytochrome c family protein
LLLVGGGVVLIGAGVALAVVFWPSQGKPNPVAGNNPPAIMPGSPDAGKGPAGGDSQPSHAGRAIYDSNGCARCHSLGTAAGSGSGPMGGKRKMDLSRVGAAPNHTVDWISEHIRDPKSHKPESRMPAYANKIQAQDLRSLAEYLASLK